MKIKQMQNLPTYTTKWHAHAFFTFAYYRELYLGFDEMLHLYTKK